MFDKQTERIIASIPKFNTLNSDELAKYIASAYSLVLRVKTSTSSDDAGEEIEKAIQVLRKLSQSLQIVSLLGTSEFKAPSAYVAAHANQLLSQLFNHSDNSKISLNELIGVIKSVLLFVNADAIPEAIGLAKQLFDTKNETSDDWKLIANNIGTVVTGPLERIKNPGSWEYNATLTLEENAHKALLHKTNEAIYHLSQAIIRGEKPTKFQDLMKVIQTQTTHSGSDQQYISPELIELHYLFLLLGEFGGKLSDAGLRRTCTSQFENKNWHALVKTLSQRTPFLWKNHIEALSKGLLKEGTSAIVTYPTGAGKTKIANLKIASVLSNSKNVIYLCPTHALEEQIASDLAKNFKSMLKVGDLNTIDIRLSNLDSASIYVMTPEKCLNAVMHDADFISNIGLVVFDEFHLLSPDENSQGRSTDALLSLLNIIQRFPDCEIVLMSAMVSNGSEVADWIGAITKREAIVLDNDWKPTKQLRGCIVFPSKELSEDATKVESNCWIFLSLRNAWDSLSTSDYKLFQLDGTKTRCEKKNGRWKANSNEIANAIALDLFRSGKSVIIFIQNALHTISVASSLSATIGPHPDKKNSEKITKLMQTASEELGGTEHILISYSGSANCHNSLLLKYERMIIDEWVKQPDPRIVVATPTLAQGINIPADAVLIVGDQRFSKDEKKQVSMPAHEILNAAGRAGRVGATSHGLVIVIPSQLVTINASKTKIDRKWMQLRSDVFSKADKCLTISDSLNHILDDDDDNEKIEYFIRRIPRDSLEETVRQSLSAHRMIKKGNEGKLEGKIKAFVKARDSLPQVDDWMNRVMIKTGLPADVLLMILNFTKTASKSKSTKELLSNLLDWTIENHLLSNALDWYLQDDAHEDDISKALNHLVSSWINGNPLSTMEAIFPKPNKYLSKSRKFVNSAIPSLSHYCESFALVYSEAQSDSNIFASTLGMCVKYGLPSPIHLAYKIEVKGYDMSRARIIKETDSLISKYDFNLTGSIEELSKSMRNAINTENL